MPIDPYAALNAMLRAEAARFSPPARKEGQDRPRADRTPADRTVPQPATAGREPESGAAGEQPQQDQPAGSAA
ncbi:hypothetical protein ACFVHW_37285 [Streptomyces sp. NPDC127110]|uniref:hypothetical protein n=1 Tax=Streptomyces sp. NPDC127110 TaxID=3345362 RepID=UPI00363175AB